jgi:hypothetical protein
LPPLKNNLSLCEIKTTSSFKKNSAINILLVAFLLLTFIPVPHAENSENSIRPKSTAYLQMPPRVDGEITKLLSLTGTSKNVCDFSPGGRFDLMI